MDYFRYVELLNNTIVLLMFNILKLINLMNLMNSQNK